MIKYRIYDKRIEIEWDTGLEYTVISKLLEILDVINIVKTNKEVKK